MKQKYTITIADIELNVITEASHEEVDRVVGIIDRRMRDISLKSKRCTRGEAALLCALDLCAEKLDFKKQIEELEDSLEDRNEKFEHLCEKYELVQKNCDRLERERARLEVENSRLRALIDDSAEGESKTEAEEEVMSASAPEIETAHGDAIDDAVAEAVPETDPKNASPKKSSGKSRVGSMFDLLTFTDI